MQYNNYMQDEHNSVTTSQPFILLLPVLANNTVEETELKQQKAKLYYDKEQTLPHLQIHLSMSNYNQ